MTTTAARLADDADLSVLTDLIDAAWSEQIDARGGSLLHSTAKRSGSGADRAEAALHSAHHTVWMGTIDSTPIGYGVVRLDRLSNGEDLAVIEDLFVLEDARQIGVGEEMTSAITSWAIQHRCIGIDAVALPGNRHTKNFFEMLGLTARAIVVHKSLRPVECISE